MARNPSYAVNVGMVDRSGERARFTVNTAALIPLNDAANAETVRFTNLIVTIQALCDGLIVNENAVISNKLTNASHALTGQREHRWLVTYQDNVTLAVYQTELPCRKVTLEPPVETDKVDLTIAPYAAFVTAFQLVAASPDGNAITVLSIELMGRNS